MIRRLKALGKNAGDINDAKSFETKHTIARNIPIVNL